MAFKDYYDLNLLSCANLPIDSLIQQVVSKNLNEIGKMRSPSRTYDMFYDVTPELVDNFKREAIEHIKTIRDNPSLYGYLYFVVENQHYWYNAPHFNCNQFPFAGRCVMNKICNMAKTLSKSHNLDYDATCLYLLYFYGLLANPHTNWITMDYLSNGNRYHKVGTRLQGKMKSCIKKIWTA